MVVFCINGGRFHACVPQLSGYSFPTLGRVNVDGSPLAYLSRVKRWHAGGLARVVVCGALRISVVMVGELANAAKKVSQRFFAGVVFNPLVERSNVDSGHGGRLVAG